MQEALGDLQVLHDLANVGFAFRFFKITVKLFNGLVQIDFLENIFNGFCAHFYGKFRTEALQSFLVLLLIQKQMRFL